MRVQRINNYSQNCSYNTGFGAIINKKFLGEFSKPSNLKRAERVISAAQELPEFTEFSNNNNIDIVLNAKPSKYITIYSRDSFQKALDLTFSIIYERPAHTKIEKLIKWFNPIKKLEVSASYLDEQDLSDKVVKKFIRNFIKTESVHSLKHKLKTVPKRMKNN